MKSCDSWKELFRNIKEKFKRSISNATLVIYSVAAILFLGNLGFWIELLTYINSKSNSLDPMVKSLLTFFPAVAIPACMQNNIIDRIPKSEKALSILIIVIIAFLAIALIMIPTTLDDGWVLMACILLSIFSYFIWLYINADNRDFKEPEPDASVGGPVSNNLNGSLEGFQS